MKPWKDCSAGVCVDCGVDESREVLMGHTDWDIAYLERGLVDGD